MSLLLCLMGWDSRLYQSTTSVTEGVLITSLYHEVMPRISTETLVRFLI
ncbi:hypothetical protein APHMUC_0875 [Anaplasma phagocytophilum str. ApMUC09]|uniref:Uncharacterized protein n=1 Tax=Anaplasma phagocytophilum str. ApMUC09 TaxID=1359152 RepID=A0A0F3NAR0_ANAPH|nr:hypothetical protein APHMUC_0875 [Anaplasma phagocytophilum str. ApMUC09]